VEVGCFPFITDYIPFGDLSLDLYLSLPGCYDNLLHRVPLPRISTTQLTQVSLPPVTVTQLVVTKASATSFFLEVFAGSQVLPYMVPTFIALRALIGLSNPIGVRKCVNGVC
jgi:hypothetical protein